MTARAKSPPEPRIAIEIAGKTFTGGISNAGAIFGGSVGIEASHVSHFSGSIANTGTISGAIGIDLVETPGVNVFDGGIVIGTGGTAIEFVGGGDTLTLAAGYTIGGTVSATGSSTLQLGGIGSDTFNLGSIGTQYKGFTTFNVSGGEWTLTSSGTGWNIIGGTAELASGGLLVSTIVRSAGTLEVLSGAHVSATTVSNGGTLVVSAGGTADPTRLFSGATEIIASGGTDDGAQISGGTQEVFGSASGTIVFGGARWWNPAARRPVRM